RPQPSPARQPSPGRPQRSWVTIAAFAVGIPLGVGALVCLQLGFQLGYLAADVVRYVSHPVENVEVILFSCALAALGAKLWSLRNERAACRTKLLPPWDGEPAPVSEAAKLWAGLNQVGWRLQNTYLVRRASAVLAFVRSRNSAADLDDHLRTLADNDALA